MSRPMIGGATSTVLVDTSVAVALLVADHERHGDVVDALGDAVLGLSGHAAFETFSVLTRMPVPVRRPPEVVQRMLAQSFPATRHLPPEVAGRLIEEASALGIAGGAIYDALVAGTARFHGLTLVTRDRRALDTYRALGADVQIL